MQPTIDKYKPKKYVYERKLDAPCCNDYRYVAPYIEIAIRVGCRYLYIGIFQTLLQRFTEDDILAYTILEC